MLLAGLLAALTATAAFAEEPVPVDGFVCPVLGGHAGEGQGKSSPDPIVMIPSGSASVLGQNVTVPTLATNDDGAGTPERFTSVLEIPTTRPSGAYRGDLGDPAARTLTGPQPSGPKAHYSLAILE